MALKTLPKSAPRLDGATLARAWLAAGAAGLAVQSDARLDRSVTLERYDQDGHPAGLVIVGVSPDLVVVAGVPYVNGPVGPQGLWDLTIETEPAHRWAVDDTSLGAVTMRQVARAAKEAAKSGGTVACTVTAQDVVPEGTLGTTGQRSYVHIAADGLTEGMLVPIAGYTPMDWHLALPGSASPTTPPSPLMRESPSVFARLGRIAVHLPTVEMEWQFYTLPSGTTIRYAKVADDGGFVEIAAVVGLTPTAPLTIYKVAPLSPPIPEDELDLDSDDDWEDQPMRAALEATGVPTT